VKTALREAQDASLYRLVPHRHEDRLSAIPEADYYFFCVRDPIERYVSGFVSRQREGLPTYHNVWSKDEAKAFSRFDSPDALAVSLSAGGTEQREAEAAMRTIWQLRTSFWDWFVDSDYFKRRSDHLLWIGRQESLDMSSLAATLGLNRLELPTDTKRANKTTSAKPQLSDLARQNLRQWYAKDYVFLELCDALYPRNCSPDRRSPDTSRNIVGRVMSVPPFALSNADALRLGRVAKTRARIVQ
jgi:hypothetical protein